MQPEIPKLEEEQPEDPPFFLVLGGERNN